METLISVVAPVFGIILTGYLAGRSGVLGTDTAVALNRFVYFFSLPVVLFVFTARAPLEEIVNLPFLGIFIGGSLLTLVVALICGRIWFRGGLEALSLQGLAAVFANTTYLGVPLFAAAYGPDGVLPAIIATVAANTLFITGTLVALEIARADAASAQRIARRVITTLACNPLLVAPFLGIAISALEWPIPKAIASYLDLLASAAGPTALFALGLSLVGRKLQGDAVEIGWLVFVKLVIHPALTFVLAAMVLGMANAWSQAAVVLAALPVGALVFVIAQQYEVYVQRASSAIVLSTALSVFTVSFLLIVLKAG